MGVTYVMLKVAEFVCRIGGLRVLCSVASLGTVEALLSNR